MTDNSVRNSTDTLSPAAKLLISAVRLSLGTADNKDLQDLAGDNVDWEVFHYLAAHHRVEALIYDALEADIDALFPDETTAWLKQRRKENVFANMSLTSSAIRIFREFEKQGVPVLFIKGLSAEEWLYEKPGLRAAGDIDLFISPTTLPQAISCMQALGYQLAMLPQRLKPGSRLAKQHLRTIKDHIFTRPGSSVVVELHWRLSRLQSAFPLGFDDAWRCRSDFQLAGNPISTLSRDTHANYLCYHGAKHYFARLFWLYDIAKLMQQEDVDWDKIVEQAHLLKAEASLGLALVMASEIFHVPIPELMSRQKGMLKTGKQLSSSIIDLILADAPTLPRPLNKAVSFSYARQKVSWNSQLHPSKYYYLSQWTYELFAPTYDEWESLELPDILTPLYRLWRPLRLGSKLLFRS